MVLMAEQLRQCGMEKETVHKGFGDKLTYTLMRPLKLKMEDMSLEEQTRLMGIPTTPLMTLPSNNKLKTLQTKCIPVFSKSD